MPAADASTSTSARPLPLVWNYHEELWHYRLPVFDAVARLGEGAYTFHAMGAMRDGRPFGASTSHPLTSETPQPLPGRPFTRSPFVERRIADVRPDVLINNCSIRNSAAWRLPRQVKRYGGVAILWSKITGYGKVSASLRTVYQRWLYRQYDLAIVYGDASRLELAQLGFPEESIFVATNTIDTRRIFAEADRFDARAAALREANGLIGKKVLLCIGRLDAAKRPLDLIDAWPRLAAIDPALVLVYVGKGTMSAEVEQRVRALGTDRVRFVGPVAEGEDYAWIAASDYTIQCGAVGLAINQSMAFGRATIVADEIGSDSQILVDGRTGFRFAKANLDDLVRVVARVVTDAETCGAVGTAARQLLGTSASLDHMTAVIDRCIRRGVELARARRRH